MPEDTYQAKVEGSDGKTYTIDISATKNEFNSKINGISKITVLNELGGEVNGRQLKPIIENIKEQLNSEGSRPTLNGQFGSQELPSKFIDQAIKQLEQRMEQEIGGKGKLAIK
jgi:hypothetical protein